MVGIGRDLCGSSSPTLLVSGVCKSKTPVMGELRPCWTRRASCPDPLPSLCRASPLAASQRLFSSHLIYFFSSPSLLCLPAPPRAEIAAKRGLFHLMPGGTSAPVRVPQGNAGAFNDSRTWR